MNDPSTKRLTFGVTGNIGSGKSTVSQVFNGFGAVVIEGDKLGRKVADESTDFRNWLRTRFGEAIFNDTVLDRSALGRIVFSDLQAREDLDRKVWPLIRELLVSQIKNIHDSGKIAVVDAALIFEWNDQNRYDFIIVVNCDPELAIKRAAKRLDLTIDDMRQRNKNQIPVEEKITRADVVIHNDGSLEELEYKAAEVWHQYFDAQKWLF